MKTEENMHCNFCVDGIYHCPQPAKYELHAPINPDTYKNTEHRFWRYICKSCGAQIDKNINPEVEVSNEN